MTPHEILRSIIVTAMRLEDLSEVEHYVPELSFGTHFFQDLVEASIRYLPLYPDDPGIRFQEHFFTRSANALADILPQYADLAETIRVIDVPKETDGRILRIAMNAELGEALGRDVLGRADLLLEEGHDRVEMLDVADLQDEARGG